MNYDFSSIFNDDRFLDLFHFSSDILYIILSVLSIILFVVLIIYFINILGKYKTYKKASKKGWEAFIPIYNTYVGCEICGISTYWILILVLIHFIVIPFPFLATVAWLARLYFKVIFSISMARSFGKSDAFAVGLFFCEPIFYLILAFGNSTYLGPKPVDDPVIKIFGVKDNNNSTGTDSSSKYCSNCGSPVKEESNYCSKCGNKI